MPLKNNVATTLLLLSISAPFNALSEEIKTDSVCREVVIQNKTNAPTKAFICASPSEYLKKILQNSQDKKTEPITPKIIIIPGDYKKAPQ